MTVIWLGRGNKPLRGFDASALPMLAPFSEQEVKAALPADGDIMLGNVDDYGGLRMNRYHCAAGQCVFQERLRQ